MKYETTPGYWDIHNHILPGVDDGSSCTEESLDMLREEYAQGIRNIVFTPHFRPGMFPIRADVREQVFEQFVEEAQRRFPDMRFYLGCELHVHGGMQELIKDARCRMAGTSAVLLEFSNSARYGDLERIVGETIAAGWRPVLAHIERYECLLEQAENVGRIRQAGAFIQVNADTFLEGMFSKRRKFVKALVERQAIDFIASDAHSMSYRPVNMQECIQVVRKHYGQAAADALFKTNAERLFRKKDKVL